jgi:hypothetical protein
MVSTVFYYIWNVLTVGFFSSIKVAVAKGMAETNASVESADMHAQARLTRLAASEPKAALTS